MTDPRQDRHFNALTAAAKECERYGEVDRAQYHRDKRWGYFDREYGHRWLTSRIFDRRSK